MNFKSYFFGSTTFLAISLSAFANDASLNWGGAPKMMTGHKSVQMKSEKIVMTVKPETVQAVCNFVFVNHGAACKVRMGFPDVGYAAGNPEEEVPENKLPPHPPSVFTSFKAYVNDKEVNTSLLRGEQGENWRVKIVTFPAHSTVRIRDVYTEPLGSRIATAKGQSLHNAHYVLYTGSSWQGNLGKTEITVRFEYPNISRPYNLIDMKLFFHTTRSDKGPAIYEASTKHSPTAHTIYFEGPCKAQIRNGTLYFVRRNYKPTPKDDLDIYFK